MLVRLLKEKEGLKSRKAMLQIEGSSKSQDKSFDI